MIMIMAAFHNTLNAVRFISLARI